MTNDVKSVKSSVKSASPGGMWHPTQSVVSASEAEATDLNCTSSTAIMVQPAPVSRNASAASYHSGHILVAPAESVKFAASSHSSVTAEKGTKEIKETTSEVYIDEIVQKHTSGTVIIDDNNI